jgi:hypothetical protein
MTTLLLKTRANTPKQCREVYDLGLPTHTDTNEIVVLIVTTFRIEGNQRYIRDR